MNFQVSKRNMQLVWTALGILLITALVNTKAEGIEISDEMKQKIDNFINDHYLPRNHHTPLSIAVNVNGTLVYGTGYGIADEARQLPATDETLYPVGSVSKSFSGVIVAKALHERWPEMGGKVLDTPIRKLVPNFNFTLNDRYRTEQITFRDIMCHRTCSVGVGFSFAVGAVKSVEEKAYRQRYAPEGCGFRTRMFYANGMYSVMNKAIEAVTGRTYNTLLFELFKDLEMYNSTIVQESDPDDEVLPGWAVPYYWSNGARHNFNPKLIKRMTVDIDSGGVVTNMQDISKYIQFHLNKGKVGERQVVPENVMEWLYEKASVQQGDVSSIQPGDYTPIGYGMGIGLGVINGWAVMEHSGGISPYQTHMSFYPALNIGIFVATSQIPTSLSLDHPELHKAIFSILRGDNATVIAKGMEKETDSKNGTENVRRSLKAYPQEVLQSLVGSYGNGLEGELEISMEYRTASNTTELYMRYGEWGRAYLLSTETDLRFQFEWDSDVAHDKHDQEEDINDTFGVFGKNGTSFLIIDQGHPSGIFIKGVSLSMLPDIPWSPDSCGAD